MPSAVFSVVASAVTAMLTPVIGPPTFFAFMVGRAVATIAVIASSIAMSAVSSSLMGASKPKMPDFGTGSVVARTRERTISVRQPIASHRIIYGQTRVGGIVTFLHTTDDNERLHQLITIAGHEVNSIGQIYLDDLAVTVWLIFIQELEQLQEIRLYRQQCKPIQVLNGLQTINKREEQRYIPDLSLIKMLLVEACQI